MVKTDNDLGGGDTEWFVKARFGMFIHWGTYALPSKDPGSQLHDRQTREDYRKYFDHFDPDLHNPEQWARTAREAGMKYLVVTSKHHEGFCLWDTKHTEFKSTNTPCGKDLLKPLVEAFRGEGLRIGFYYSLIDWNHPEFPVDRLHPMWRDKEFCEREKGRDIRKYAQYVRDQVTELLTEFGEIDIMWCDYAYPGKDGKGRDEWESEKLVRLVRELRPGIILNDRMDLPAAADIITPEQYVPADGMTDENGNPAIWESCQTMADSWTHNRDERDWKSVPILIRQLIENVSRGGNMLLNVGPTGRGEFSPNAMSRLKGIGEWMKRHGRAIYACTRAPDRLVAPTDLRYTYNPETNRLYVHFFDWPFRSRILPDLADRIEYAQLLSDASEVAFENTSLHPEWGESSDQFRNGVRIGVPVDKPDAEVPVIELFLKR
jgi:alpha-L-fucosidase